MYDWEKHAKNYIDFFLDILFVSNPAITQLLMSRKVNISIRTSISEP